MKGEREIMPLAIYSDLETARTTVLRRQFFDDVAIPPSLQASLDGIFGAGTTPAVAVERIISDVRSHGDEALRRYSREIEGVELSSVAVEQDEMDQAVAAVDPELIAALRQAAERIERFHAKQTRQSWIDWSDEGALGQIVVPLEHVGIYVPGGTAPLPSSLLMAAIPARVAGVDEIVVCSPPHSETGTVAPVVLAAAAIAGVRRVFKLGGAQAIAALAYGTQSVARVDKIVGPGNVYVAEAKRQVYGEVGIDMLAGPSEILVISDGAAPADWLAMDLFSQAEHDEAAQAVLLSPDANHLDAVATAIERLLG